MKKFLFMFLIFSLLLVTQAHSQPDLNIVWQKNLAPWGAVDFAKIAPDGSIIYIASYNTIWKIDAKTSELDTVPFDKKGTAGIYYMDISQKGNYIVTKDGGTAVNIWDIHKEKSIKYMPDAGYPTMTPDEKYVLIAGYNKIIIYSMEVDSIIKQIPINGTALRIKSSHDGKYFATGSQYYDQRSDKTYDQLILWDAVNWMPIDTLETILGSRGDSYKDIRFSWDDKNLGVVRQLPYDARIFDLKYKTVIVNSDKNLVCGKLEFLPDNSSFFLFYTPPTGLLRINLNTKNIIKNYDYYASIIETTDTINGIFSIFISDGSNMYFMKSSLTGILPELKSEIKISYFDKKLNFELTKFNYDIISVQIIDILGKVIFNDNLENLKQDGKETINLNLSSGTYFCKLKYGGKEYVQQIIVTR